MKKEKLLNLKLVSKFGEGDKVYFLENGLIETGSIVCIEKLEKSNAKKNKVNIYYRVFHEVGNLCRDIIMDESLLYDNIDFISDIIKDQKETEKQKS